MIECPFLYLNCISLQQELEPSEGGGEALHLCCNTLIIVKFIICIGSGKSVLAAESVRDPDIAVHVFPGGVFWVKVKR